MSRKSIPGHLHELNPGRILWGQYGGTKLTGMCHTVTDNIRYFAKTTVLYNVGPLTEIRLNLTGM